MMTEPRQEVVKVRRIKVGKRQRACIETDDRGRIVIVITGEDEPDGIEHKGKRRHNCD